MTEFEKGTLIFTSVACQIFICLDTEGDALVNTRTLFFRLFRLASVLGRAKEKPTRENTGNSFSVTGRFWPRLRARVTHFF